MTMISSDAKQLLLPEAARLGYAPPIITSSGHILWEHQATGERAITHARLHGRGIKNARAASRRRACANRQPRGSCQ